MAITEVSVLTRVSDIHATDKAICKFKKKKRSQVQTVILYPDKNPKRSINFFNLGFAYPKYQDISSYKIP